MSTPAPAPGSPAAPGAAGGPAQSAAQAEVAATRPQFGERLTPEKALIRGVISETMFAQQAVKLLSSNDFTLDAETLITLKYSDCILVLFYGNNKESRDLVEIWAAAAEQTVGPVFAACNLSVERQVASAFTKLQTRDNPLHHFALKGLPFILVYNSGWPKAFYNGERAVSAIIDFALTLACQPGYREDISLFASLRPDANLAMSGISEYDMGKKQSLEFKGDKPIRDYDDKLGVVVPGSQEATIKTVERRTEEKAAGAAGVTPGGADTTAGALGSGEQVAGAGEPSTPAIPTPSV